MKNMDKAIQYAESAIANCMEEMQASQNMVASAYVVGKETDGVVPMPYRSPKEKEAMTVALGEIARQMEASELFFACSVTVVDGPPNMTINQINKVPQDDRRKGITVTYVDFKSASGFLMTQEIAVVGGKYEPRKKTFEEFTEGSNDKVTANYLFSIVLPIWRGERNIKDTIGPEIVGRAINRDPAPDDPFHGIDMSAKPNDPRFPESERA